MGQITEETQRERHMQAVILAACIVGHIGLGFWLARAPLDLARDDVALQISFIPAPSEAVQVLAPPPFPAAPQRASRNASRPRATPSAPPDRPATQAQSAPESLPADLLQPRPSTARLLDAAQTAARAGIDTAMPAARDPTQRRAARVPGRVEAYTPEAYVLRREISPEDVVNAIGGLLFGGNIDPCPDTRSKIHDLVARNDPRSEDELRVLIDRERRRCR